MEEKNSLIESLPEFRTIEELICFEKVVLEFESHNGKQELFDIFNKNISLVHDELFNNADFSKLLSEITKLKKYFDIFERLEPNIDRIEHTDGMYSPGSFTAFEDSEVLKKLKENLDDQLLNFLRYKV